MGVTDRRLPVVLMLALAAAGCGQGGASRDPGATARSVAPVTLTVWDQEVRTGQSEQIERLNRAFETQNPGVTITRVAKSFDNLNKTLKLAVSSSRAPDVVQANQGRPIMGELVAGRLLEPLEGHLGRLGWTPGGPGLLLDLNRFSTGGRVFGKGSLYGLSQMGEIVGVFFNREKVGRPPRTLAEFEASLQRARAAGEIPIQLGNREGWPGIHAYETVLGRAAGRRAVRDFVFGRQGASFTRPAFRAAARRLRSWARAGYLAPGFGRQDYDRAWQRFAAGEGAYLIAGTWLTADLARRMGPDVGFMLLPGERADERPVALGGGSVPFAITAQSEHPELAARYIAFITGEKAAPILAETGNLPAAPGGEGRIPVGVPTDVARAWKALTGSDGLIPYLDYTTPTAEEDVGKAVRALLAGRATPAAFTAGIQSRYERFLERGP